MLRFFRATDTKALSDQENLDENSSENVTTEQQSTADKIVAESVFGGIRETLLGHSKGKPTGRSDYDDVATLTSKTTAYGTFTMTSAAR